jgi:PleD family two-component response regulator
MLLTGLAVPLVGRADMTLYRVKDQGRNSVRLSVGTVVA